MAQPSGLAGLFGLLDHSLFLVSVASEGRVLAVAEAVAFSSVAAGVGGDVGGDGADHVAMARGASLFKRLVVGSSIVFVWRRIVAVLAVEQELQRAAAGRRSGSGQGSGRAALGDDRDSCTGQASGIFGASLRNAGVEYWDRAGGLLWADGVRSAYGRSHDSDGGSRT